MTVETANAFSNEWSIPVGTEVLDVNGESIGKVTSYDGFNLIVTNGLLLLHDYEVSMGFVGDFVEGKLLLTCPKETVVGE